MVKFKKKKKTTNEFILKRKRKKMIQRLILIFTILFIGFLLFVSKSDFFTVKKVVILGNPIMSGENVKTNTEYLLGKNIFFINKSEIINEAKKNPYVDDVKVTRTLPKQVNIELKEKQSIFYVKKGEEYYVFGDDATLLEKTTNIDNRTLINIIGIDISGVNSGEIISDNSRIVRVLKTFSKISEINPSNYRIDSLDLTNLIDIKVYIGDIEGKLGDDDNIQDKMNKVLHIVQNTEVNIKKGYIDVGFDGPPIYFKE